MAVPRRQFLERSAALGAALWQLGATWTQRAPSPLGDARLVRTVPLGRFDGRPTPPLEKVLGTGLDARQFLDLSTLTADTLITSNARFFVRTTAPPRDGRDPWTVRVGGRVQRALDLAVDDIRSMARPAGTHLMECAGNTDSANYGLISAAQWAGAPIAALLDRVLPLTGPWRVRVTGIDHPGPARTSIAGASWVFSRDDLERSGAFLATEMNGVPLPPDYGFPVRLVVPGWYGCACIKWVSAIELVQDDEPATSQMREFARRTHQDGAPAVAREYAPARIDLAATPIRVEQWVANGRPTYRVVGIMWGGERPTDALTIRFRHNQPFAPVSDCPLPPSTHTWSLWSHVWRPDAPGRYQIVLRTTDSAVRTRRLDIFAYTREVEIEQV